MNKEKSTVVPALDKGLKILEILSRNQDFMTMSQIAKSMDYKVSEIQRMVEYLFQNGYINKNHQGGFYISSKFFSLASRIDFHHILISRATPLMNQFALSSCESIQLSVLVDRELLLLVHTEGTRTLRLSIKPGMYDPMETISGKVLISHLSEIDQDKFSLSREDHKNLKKIKKSCDTNGYCVGESSCLQGIYKLSTYIRSTDSVKAAALTCSFALPREEKLAEYRKKLIDKLLETKEKIEELL
ncbi:IclR family transcriptional regulator [Spirochaeta isovalerica]|uniref:DNA-binding IclR family transcriptional regulator n=1 Tax=Spirochaeta isovalerica TaxID=150 RepID=A0A841RES0_9SPIO|nr:helix-turn-helix domain-containing protein [Spirochaeta isovalerica]MBB6481500.1 DNA-binding IclR family transcriptional regulator [Spirochaeta isovalerica]